MRMLILGGTVFLSYAVAAHARRRGHEVTCAARFVSGPAVDGVRTVRLDRDDPVGLLALRGEHYDAVIDTASQPPWVRQALDLLSERTGHWIYVSSGAAYADQGTPRQRASTAPLRAASAVDLRDDSDATYGARKVACEQLVLAARGTQAAIVRPGLIVGPRDPTDRFGYWPLRLARAGEVLAPGSPDDSVQCADVRDLAAWMVILAEERISGRYDASGPAMRRADFLARISDGVNGTGKLTWVDQKFLLSNRIQPWMGVNSLPLWVPLPDFAGVLDRDTTDTLAAGFVVRDVSVTARDLLSWYRSAPGPHRLSAGISAEIESDLLTRYRYRS